MLRRHRGWIVEVRFKLDENLGTRTRQVFLDAGHDVQTVRDEELQGCTDETLYHTIQHVPIGGAW